MKPGWHVRNDMFRTLGFWDGEGWTKQTAPSYKGIQTSVRTVAGGVVLGSLFVLLIGFLMSAFVNF